jgi:hypothetical protein
MNTIQNTSQGTSNTPVLQRLHEVTERIRRRAAEARAREAARTGRWAGGLGSRQRELPLRLVPMPALRSPAVPRHWSDEPDEEKSAA